VQLEVEAAGVANGVALVVPAPKGGGLGVTIAAAHALAARRRHALVRPRLGPVDSVGLAVEAAGIAQIVAVYVAPPEGRVGGAAIDALAARLASCRLGRVGDRAELGRIGGHRVRQARRRRRGARAHRMVMVVVVVMVLVGGRGGGHGHLVLVLLVLVVGHCRRGRRRQRMLVGQGAAARQGCRCHGGTAAGQRGGGSGAGCAHLVQLQLLLLLLLLLGCLKLLILVMLLLLLVVVLDLGLMLLLLLVLILVLALVRVWVLVLVLVLAGQEIAPVLLLAGGAQCRAAAQGARWLLAEVCLLVLALRLVVQTVLVVLLLMLLLLVLTVCGRGRQVVVARVVGHVLLDGAQIGVLVAVVVVVAGRLVAVSAARSNLTRLLLAADTGRC